MALGLFLQASLMIFLLATDSKGQTTRAPLYRFQEDTRNLEDDWTNPDDGGVGKELANDDSDPINLSSSQPDASEYRPVGDSSVNSHARVNSNPTNAVKFNSNSGVKMVKDRDKPLTFSSNQHLKPQVSSGDRTLVRPLPQPPPHPYITNRHASQSSFPQPSYGRYSGTPVALHRQPTNTFREEDSTSPYFYNRNPFNYPLYSSFGGTLNRHGNFRQETSPKGYPANTQAVHVPEGQGQSFSKRNYVPLNYRPHYEQMDVSRVEHNQPKPWIKTKPAIPRYIVQSRNGYRTNRYLASKISYDPEV